MNTDSINQHKASNDDCNEESILLLIDFIDGILSDDKANEVQNHIDSCIKCMNIYQSMIKSKTMIDKAKSSKNEYINSIVETRKTNQISKIKELINKEHQIKFGESLAITAITKNISQKDVTTDVLHHNKKIFSIFKSRSWVYASTAAGVAVLIFVSYIFMSGNFNLDNIYKKSLNTTKLTEQPVDMAGSRANEITGNQQETAGNASDTAINDTAQASQNFAGTPKASSYCTSSTVSTVSKSIVQSSVGNATAPCNESVASPYGILPNAGVKENDINNITIASNQSQELWTIIQGATTYLEICNNIDFYNAIVVFSSTIIQAKETRLLEIKNKLILLNLTTKIEFISGEDEQKLVEYTSKENASLLRTNAVANSADFLVISIYR